MLGFRDVLEMFVVFGAYGKIGPYFTFLGSGFSVLGFRRVLGNGSFCRGKFRF